MYFPKLRYPNVFYDIKGREITVADVDPHLHEPHYQYFEKIINPSKTIVKDVFGCSIGLFIPLVLLLGFSLEETLLKTRYFVHVTAGLCLFFSLVFNFITWFFDKKKDEQAKLTNELKNRQYKEELSIYSVAVEAALSSNNIINARRHLLKKTCKYSSENLLISSTTNVKKGRSESWFASELKNELDYKIIQNVQVGYYFPDFIIYDSERNIFMNLEIDEPYDILSRLPIHCNGQDDHRDMYFQSLGFIVLRFSEQQIVENSSCCIQLIKLVFDGFSNLTEVESSNDLFQKLKYEGWNEEKAVLLSKSCFREKLLKRIKN